GRGQAPQGRVDQARVQEVDPHARGALDGRLAAEGLERGLRGAVGGEWKDHRSPLMVLQLVGSSGASRASSAPSVGEGSVGACCSGAVIWGRVGKLLS